MIYARPNSSFSAFTEPGSFASGLEGTLGTRIERVDGTTHTARTTAGIIELEAGAAVYAATLTSPSTLGRYAVLWDDGAGGFALEELEVAYTLPTPVPGGPGILTLEEYKAFAGYDPTNDQDDARIEALLPAVTRAIEKYCDRKFEVAAGGSQERTFSFDGEGIVEIDDCVAVSSVTTDAGVLGEIYPLLPEQWTAQPGDSSETYYYLQIHSGPFHSFSPEMGFERNLDRYESFEDRPVTVTVLATWGWPAIPEDVQLAAAFMVGDILSKPDGDNLQSEAIEGYARAWAGSFSSLSIPNRSRDLLVNYQRVF